MISHFIAIFCLFIGLWSSVTAQIPMNKISGIDAVMKNSSLSPMLGCACVRTSFLHNLVKYASAALPDAELAKTLFLVAADGTIEYAPRGHIVAHYIPSSAWARVIAVLMTCQQQKMAVSKTFSPEQLLKQEQNRLIKKIQGKEKILGMPISTDEKIRLSREITLLKQKQEQLTLEQIEKKQVHTKNAPTPSTAKVKTNNYQRLVKDLFAALTKDLNDETNATFAAGLERQEAFLNHRIGILQKQSTEAQQKIDTAAYPQKLDLQEQVKQCAEEIKKINNCELPALAQKRINSTKSVRESNLKKALYDGLQQLAEKIAHAKLWCADESHRSLCFEYTTEWIILSAVWMQAHDKSAIRHYFETLYNALGKRAPEFMNPISVDFDNATLSTEDLNKITQNPAAYLNQPGSLLWIALELSGLIDHAKKLPVNFGMASGVLFQNQSFPDCGENVIRKIFNAITWDWKNKRFDSNILETCKELTICPKVINFYKLFPQEENQSPQNPDSVLHMSDQEMHSIWAAAISGLPENDPVHPIIYASKGCDFRGGWKSFESVLFFLTGAESLDALMQIFGWEKIDTNDYRTKQYRSEKGFLEITAPHKAHYAATYRDCNISFDDDYCTISFAEALLAHKDASWPAWLTMLLAFLWNDPQDMVDWNYVDGDPGGILHMGYPELICFNHRLENFVGDTMHFAGASGLNLLESTEKAVLTYFCKICKSVPHDDQFRNSFIQNFPIAPSALFGKVFTSYFDGLRDHGIDSYLEWLIKQTPTLSKAELLPIADFALQHAGSLDGLIQALCNHYLSINGDRDGYIGLCKSFQVLIDQYKSAQPIIDYQPIESPCSEVGKALMSCAVEWGYANPAIHEEIGKMLSGLPIDALLGIFEQLFESFVSCYKEQKQDTSFTRQDSPSYKKLQKDIIKELEKRGIAIQQKFLEKFCQKCNETVNPTLVAFLEAQIDALKK